MLPCSIIPPGSALDPSSPLAYFSGMFIEFEETPNPDTLKFLPGRVVLERGTRAFRSVDEAENSPLAQALFGLDGVAGVFLGADFVSVSKADGVGWAALKPLVLTELMQHFTSGMPVVTDTMPSDAQGGEADSEIVRQIRELLETRVAPAVAMDGGHIAFSRFEDGVVYLRMEGACSGCPSSTMTLKHGIENLLKHYVPEVERVEPEE